MSLTLEDIQAARKRKVKAKPEPLPKRPCAKCNRMFRPESRFNTRCVTCGKQSIGIRECRTQIR